MKRQNYNPSPHQEVNFLSTLNMQVLSVGYADFKSHQWAAPKATSMFWSLYVPDKPGLVLGSGKGALKVPANSVALVPPGASAARDNDAALKCLYAHFDVGGYAGIWLGYLLNKTQDIPATSHKSALASVKNAFDGNNPFTLQLQAGSLILNVLTDVVSKNKPPRKLLPPHDVLVQKVRPALQTIEERLNGATYQPLKINEMAQLCGLKPLEFSHAFYTVVGQNPSQYAQQRRTAVAVAQLLFTDKSIDEISQDLAFANRFYFSRVFKEEVGGSPAAYRDAFHGAA